MIEGILACVGVLMLGLVMLGLVMLASVVILGWRLCEWDVKQRLSGKKPVDDYWRKRGMK